MNSVKFEMPRNLDFEKDSFSATYGKFIVEPFERGFGLTLGNAIRRTLLSSIQGAAITSIKINNVLHEFSTISGVMEDVPQIILNLKQVKVKLHTDTFKKIYLSVSGIKDVKAGDITYDDDVEIVNPGQHIATLSDKKAALDIEMSVEKGYGYKMADNGSKEGESEGIIPIDAVFTPVKKVRFNIEDTRVGQITNYEKLIMEIWTDGRIKPDDALSYAAQILQNHLTIFINIEEETISKDDDIDENKEKVKELLKKSIEELELSVRSANCLKVANIKTIGDLVKKTEQDMLKYRNFGRKSLKEIKDIIVGMGLSFGMNVNAILKDEK